MQAEGRSKSPGVRASLNVRENNQKANVPRKE